MFDESHVWAVIGWLECERREDEHCKYEKEKYPYVAGYRDALNAVYERLRGAFGDAALRLERGAKG